MRWVGWALLAAGCSPALFGQTDSFPEKLQKGCATPAACRRLVAEADARISRCRDNEIGSIRCSDARADAILARNLLDERVREETERKEAEQQRVHAEQLAQQRAAEDERERLRLQVQLEAERTRRETKERAASEQAAEDAAAQARWEQSERERHEREAAAEKARQEAAAQEAERLRLLGPTGRESELRRCFKTEPDCDSLLELLIAAAANDGEKARLAKLHQQLSALPPPGSSPAPRGVRCRDGSSSGCACGGSMRGCCSHHGGVAGCE